MGAKANHTSGLMREKRSTHIPQLNEMSKNKYHCLAREIKFETNSVSASVSVSNPNQTFARWFKCDTNVTASDSNVTSESGAINLKLSLDSLWRTIRKKNVLCNTLTNVRQPKNISVAAFRRWDIGGRSYLQPQIAVQQLYMREKFCPEATKSITVHAMVRQSTKYCIVVKQCIPLRPRGHNFVLPSCHFERYKRSFINRCLFKYV